MAFKMHLILAQVGLILIALDSVAAQGRGRASERIPGAFIVQLIGECAGKCRGELQSALASNEQTSGCTFASAGSAIGALDFEFITCPPKASVEAEALSAVLSSQADVGSVPKIENVQPDAIVSTAAAETTLYGLDQTDGGLPTDGLRTCSMTSNNGEGVNVWILDTGCTPANGGMCAGFYGGKVKCRDVQGHGTHVGGTATDAVYGVAPAAARSCVKVLGNSGSGSVSNILKGISTVTKNLNMFGKGDVINMSLGGGFNSQLNDGVTEARSQGVWFALAAGNSAQNACGSSPASAVGEGIFTVQAHDSDLNAASFTNFGTAAENCVDLSAPGVAIESTSVRGGSVSYSGTSMASPHVAGACAILLSDGLVPSVDLLTAEGATITRTGALEQPSIGLACAF